MLVSFSCACELLLLHPLQYVIIIAFIILLEIIAAILGFVFHGKVENRYEENLENAFEKYTSPDDDDYDESNNEAVDFIQKNVSLEPSLVYNPVTIVTVAIVPLLFCYSLSAVALEMVRWTGVPLTPSM